MERDFRYAPLVVDQRSLISRFEEFWPSLEGASGFAKVVAEVASKIEPQSAFYFPPSGTIDRGVYMTRHSIYTIERRVDHPVQGVAYLVLGIPFDSKIYPSYRKIVESKLPLEEVNKNLQILRGLSPNSKRIGKVDQVFQAFRLEQKETQPCYLPRLEHRGHIAIYNAVEGSLSDINFGHLPYPVTAALHAIEDVLSGLGSMHRADLVHGAVCGASCSVDFVQNQEGEKSVSLSLIHLASRLGERRENPLSHSAEYRAPGVWREGVLGQVKGELVSPGAIDKAYDLFSFGRMVQNEMLRDLLLHYGEKLHYPTAPLVAQYFLPQSVVPHPYSEGDLRWFEQQNPGRVFYAGRDDEGKIHLIIFKDPQEVFEKTVEVIHGLGGMTTNEADRSQLKRLLDLALLARGLQENDYFRFVWNLVGEQGLVKENHRDDLVRAARDRVREILGEERLSPPITPSDFGLEALREDPIEDDESDSQRNMFIPSSFPGERQRTAQIGRFIFPGLGGGQRSPSIFE